jgi:hypothetical protein
MTPWHLGAYYALAIFGAITAQIGLTALWMGAIVALCILTLSTIRRALREGVE